MKKQLSSIQNDKAPDTLANKLGLHIISFANDSEERWESTKEKLLET